MNILVIAIEFTLFLFNGSHDQTMQTNAQNIDTILGSIGNIK